MYSRINSGNHEIQIYHEIKGEGTPLICVHGFQLDHRVMKGCLEPVFACTPGFKRIYFDLPGMGRTKIPKGFRTADQILELVMAFIDAVLAPGEKFVIAGESYGGYIARAVIRKMPERVLGAFLLCPVIFAPPSERSLPPHTVLEKDEGITDGLDFFDRSQFEANIVIQTGEVWRRFRDQVLCGIKAADTGALDEIWNGAYGFFGGADDFEAPYEGPSLVICGKNDSTVGYKDALGLFKNFTRLSYAALENCGHYLQIERPEIFEALTADWLKIIKVKRV